MTIEVEFNTEELDNLIRKFPDAIERVMELTAESLLENIKQEAPYRTGRLQESWASEKMEALQWGLYSHAPYRWAVQGSVAHDITPKTASVLVLYTSAGILFRPRASHPGSQENRYIERAMELTNASLDGIMDSVEFE